MFEPVIIPAIVRLRALESTVQPLKEPAHKAQSFTKLVNCVHKLCSCLEIKYQAFMYRIFNSDLELIGPKRRYQFQPKKRRSRLLEGQFQEYRVLLFIALFTSYGENKRSKFNFYKFEMHVVFSGIIEHSIPLHRRIS